MRLAGSAGLVAVLAVLPAASGGRNETKLEREVRMYLESNQRYHQLLGVPDSARLGGITCGRARHVNVLECEISVPGEIETWTGRSARFLVFRMRHRAFALHACPGGVSSGDQLAQLENDPCHAEIVRG